MAIRGAKPKPPGQRAGHRPDPHPVVLAGRPTAEDIAEPPEHLPPEAKELWRRDVRTLIDVALVDRVDRGALEAMCIAYARALQAGRVIVADGLFVANGRGVPTIHPAVRIERDAWDAYLRLAEHYGMTPIARIRLGTAELGRRSLQAELQDKFGPMKLEAVEATAEPA